jgi:hypothetical protein
LDSQVTQRVTTPPISSPNDPVTASIWSASPLGFCNAAFVFGSNLVGHHSRGAALDARTWLGAEQGVASGMTGECYAIPTKDKALRTLPHPAIAEHVAAFLRFAAENPDRRFQLTRIGCGLSGFRDEEIAPLFKGYTYNVILPGAWNSFMSRPSCRVLLDVEPGASPQRIGAAMAEAGKRVTGEDVRRSIVMAPTSARVELRPMARVWRALALPDPTGRFPAMPPEDRLRIRIGTLIWFCSDLVSVSANGTWRSPLEREAREARLNVIAG